MTKGVSWDDLQIVEVGLQLFAIPKGSFGIGFDILGTHGRAT